MVIINNIDPEIFNFSFLAVRWYGLLFVLGFVLAYFVIRVAFKREQYDLLHLESISLYMLIGLLVGARLGHVLFYNFAYYSAHPIEIFYIWQGGLASHGAAIGVLLAYLIWARVYKVQFSKYIDLLVLGFSVMSMFVRIGNYMNSEIIGKPTNGDFGVIFQRLGETFPRHPAQLYEALQNTLIFIVLISIYKKYYHKLPRLFIMFLYILLYFSTRFIIEFWKERDILENFTLSMGQVLSLLPILIALGYFIWLGSNKIKNKEIK